MVSQTSDPGVLTQQVNPRPRSITLAVQLMMVGAALSFVSALLSFLIGLPDYRAELRRDTDFSSGHITLALWATFLVTIGFAGIGVLVWLWMAWKNGQGRPWARVLATTFFAISTLGTVGLVWTPREEALAEIAVSLAIWLVGLGAVILMWQRESTFYYHSSAARRVASG